MFTITAKIQTTISDEAPVEMTWKKQADEMDVMHSVSTLLNDFRSADRWTKLLSITITKEN